MAPLVTAIRESHKLNTAPTAFVTFDIAAQQNHIVSQLHLTHAIFNEIFKTLAGQAKKPAAARSPSLPDSPQTGHN
jgi:hypothetical protein